MQQELVEAIKDESALYGAMEAEREVRAQREAAKRILAQRRQELGQLMSRCDMRFSSLTPVEEVMQAHTRAQALRSSPGPLFRIDLADTGYEPTVAIMMPIRPMSVSTTGQNASRLRP